MQDVAHNYNDRKEIYCATEKAFPIKRKHPTIAFNVLRTIKVHLEKMGKGKFL